MKSVKRFVRYACILLFIALIGSMTWTHMALADLNLSFLPIAILMSPPPHAEIFGVDSDGKAFLLPHENLCVRPGNTLRLLADGVSYDGERGFFPKTDFHWSFSYDEQPKYSWDQNDQSGPFAWGSVPDSVNLKISDSFEREGVVETRAYTPTRAKLLLVNPNHSNTPCRWINEIIANEDQ